MFTGDDDGCSRGAGRRVGVSCRAAAAPAFSADELAFGSASSTSFGGVGAVSALDCAGGGSAGATVTTGAPLGTAAPGVSAVGSTEFDGLGLSSEAVGGTSEG